MAGAAAWAEIMTDTVAVKSRIARVRSQILQKLDYTIRPVTQSKGPSGTVEGSQGKASESPRDDGFDLCLNTTKRQAVIGGIEITESLK